MLRHLALRSLKSGLLELVKLVSKLVLLFLLSLVCHIIDNSLQTYLGQESSVCPLSLLSEACFDAGCSDQIFLNECVSGIKRDKNVSASFPIVIL